MAVKGKEEPTPVIIDEEQKAVPVIITEAVNKVRKLVKKGEGITLSPTTTEAEDRVKEGQRHVNLIWENTQSRIALLVVSAGVLINTTVVILVVIFNREVTVTQLSLVSICLQFINLTVGIVIGFYFARTNHQATGGVGPKAEEGPYVGR